MNLASFSFALAALTCASMSSTTTHAFVAPSARSTRQTQQSSPLEKQILFGIMDEVNSDAFDLSSLLQNDDEPSTSEMENAYEMFLGQLVFSSNDPRIDIMDNYELCVDPKWLSWLERKIGNTRDVE